MKRIVLLGLLLSFTARASFTKPTIHTYDWEGIKVVYLEDNQLPLYYVNFYFADGSLSDYRVKGETTAMLSTLDLGTRRFSRNDIQDNLEFFGVNYSSSVTHEYSTFSFSGLVKDIIPTTKKICHLFADAVFPESELRKERTKYRNSLLNLVSNPSSLASRSFRELSLKDTPYDYPTEGKLKDLNRIKTKGLKKKLEYFNSSVQKRIYISGPKDTLNIKSIVLNECGWDLKNAKFVRKVPLPNGPIVASTPEIHLVTIPRGNQAQVMIGRHLHPDEFKEDELLSLTSGFLGGGFTSMLMREVRVKRGLTYGISAFAAGQKEYGRAGISSATRYESVSEMLNVIKETIQKISTKEYPEEDLERARGLLIGSYPFRFESKSAFLGQILYLDHVGRSYDDFFNFQDNLKKLTAEDVARKAEEIFGWNKQIIVILGEKKLLSELRKLGKVKVHNYQRFL